MHVRMSGEIQLFATLFDNLGHRAYSAHEMPTEADEIQQGETDERPLEGHGWNPLCLYQLSFSEVQAKWAVWVRSRELCREKESFIIGTSWRSTVDVRKSSSDPVT